MKRIKLVLVLLTATVAGCVDDPAPPEPGCHATACMADCTANLPDPMKSTCDSFCCPKDGGNLGPVAMRGAR